MQENPRPFQVAIVGAGIAGSTCAQALARAGCGVQVFDKSRGPGGRLATRRLRWLDDRGEEQTVSLDHGAPGFGASDAEFRRFLRDALPPGTLADWRPRLAPGSRPFEGSTPLWRPQPDMPALCRALLDGIPLHTGVTIDRLHKGPLGWQLEAAGQRIAGPFDAVLLALPPAQAATLLGEHRHDWARRAALALMQPCWTLMAVAQGALPDPGWDLGLPEAGPLASVHRQDACPGRAAARDSLQGTSQGVSQDMSLWVAHARTGWSRQHLEAPADGVRGQLLQALQDWLAALRPPGLTRPPIWREVTAHRWRYAQPVPGMAATSPPCWWDGTRGLGACGDFLGSGGAPAGGAPAGGVRGVEGAWLSAQALIACVLRDAHPAQPLLQPAQPLLQPAQPSSHPAGATSPDPNPSGMHPLQTDAAGADPNRAQPCGSPAALRVSARPTPIHLH